jgi:hypothetical protein
LRLQRFSITSGGFTTFTNPATGIYISGGIATVPINLTGYTAALQIRSLPESPTAVLSLATGGNGITIPTPTNGTVEVQATAAQTRAIVPGTYYYDIEITSQAALFIVWHKAKL